MCFCGATNHATGTCRDCGSRIAHHVERGLTGWFALGLNSGTYSEGDCSRDAMSGAHRDLTPEQVEARSWQRHLRALDAGRASQ